MLTQNAIALLQDLIRLESFSGAEDRTAARIEEWFSSYDIAFQRKDNNIWATNNYFDHKKPTLLLNSHHDTVRPNQGYTRNPYSPDIEDGKLYGLGSNDAGGALVSLIACFTHFYKQENLDYNLLMVASAEEESAGKKSLRYLIPDLPQIDVAIVGEPTLIDLAIAEKGLVVFDLSLKGTASHAAHPNEDNPLMKLPKLLKAIDELEFEKVSPLLGPVKATLTQLNAGSQHNVVPSEVNMVLDVRVNECYSNKEIEQIIKSSLDCEVKARSLILKSSSIDPDHPLVKAGIALGKKTYGSPTLSDQAGLDCPSLKLGPGDSTRSHSANEFIFVREIEEGITFYINLLNQIL
jgi:acetylornithine deacetylase